MTDWGGPAKHFASCYYCRKQRNMTEQGQSQYYEVLFGGRTDFTTYLLACDVCGKPGMYVTNGSDVNDELRRLFPAPSRITAENVPDSIKREHREAVTCFEANAHTACVVMVRRTLEGICADKNATGKTLDQKLRNLNENNHLDKRLFDWATNLRSLGNDGAHFTGRAVNSEDARDALMLCEALIENLYVLEAQFVEFKERRTRAATPAEDDDPADE